MPTKTGQGSRPYHRCATAKLARNTSVKQLVLHHISRRYRPQDVLAEAQAIFPDTFVASDLDLFQIVKNKPVQVRNLHQRN